MSGCPTFDGAGPSGIAEALRVVDCMSGEAASFAFARLFGTDALLGQALTAALTLYIGFYAIGLLTGRTSLSLSSLTPRMMTLGIALTFATSWVAYQSVIWNLLVGAPTRSRACSSARTEARLHCSPTGSTRSSWS
ncbi:type IV secretion system protein [Sphingomonas sediminicola]|uniref:Type IV secretion system protein n=1 Tax=Sphingomonas sediminicola TaxID=386874 RepID=A0ABX6T8H0_9SPHN|nr:type IV secretion system protein [Sphingomonas sediminicola]